MIANFKYEINFACMHAHVETDDVMSQMINGVYNFIHSKYTFENNNLQYYFI